MGRAPCCDKANVKKGPWSPEEDAKLKEYIEKNGTGGNWIALPHKVGLRRCGKSCRLRWLNYLRPNIKHGQFSDDEDTIICTLFATIGSRWSIIAAQLPGRTDNDIKNYWNTKLKKKLINNMANNYNNTLHPPPLLHHYSSMAAPSPLHAQIPLLCENSPPTATAAISCGFATSTIYNHDVGSGEEDRKNHNALIFGGGDQASCSSSEISHGGDQIQSFCFQGYSANGVDRNQNFSFTSSSPPSAAASYGCFGDTLQDYYASIEEIKELITGNGAVTYNDNLSFFMDEIKTEEKVWCNDQKVFRV